jgi:hypothetical protein
MVEKKKKASKKKSENQAEILDENTPMVMADDAPNLLADLLAENQPIKIDFSAKNQPNPSEKLCVLDDENQPSSSIAATENQPKSKKKAANKSEQAIDRALAENQENSAKESAKNHPKNQVEKKQDSGKKSAYNPSKISTNISSNDSTENLPIEKLKSLKELSAIFGISESTLRRYKDRDPSFPIWQADQYCPWFGEPNAVREWINREVKHDPRAIVRHEVRVAIERIEKRIEELEERIGD